MKEIKIQNSTDGSWESVSVIDFTSREDEVEIQRKGESPEWVHHNMIHPADKVAITVEKLASTRYEFVPKEDLE